MKVFILAGGFGTRLSHIVKDVPKPMAPIQGKPFLEYLIRNLKKLDLTDIVLLTGYKSETIEDYFKDGSSFGVQIRYSRETTPLGTGGAIKKAADTYGNEENIVVMNGDTYFDAEIRQMLNYQASSKSSLTIALKYMKDVKRYGSVKLSKNRITEFVEKRSDLEDGYINGGIYVIGQNALNFFKKEGMLSLENEVLPEILNDTGETISGIPFGGRFIDIGVPEDYYKAGKVLEEWTGSEKIKAAFLDRDGTINEDSGYTYRIEDLQFVPGAVNFLKELQRLNYKLIIVTNQAGIAKDRFNENDYFKFQKALCNSLEKEGVHILDTFYSPYHKEGIIGRYKKDSLLRKPYPGMILEAADKYNIDLSQSIMIGDRESDSIESLPYFKCFIIQGKYPLAEIPQVYKNFDEIILKLKNLKGFTVCV